MSRARSFAGLLLFGVLAASAAFRVHAGSEETLPDQAPRVTARPVPDPGTLIRAIPAGGDFHASRPLDEARRAAASKSFADLSGGPTGMLLVGTALLAAGALLLAVFIPW